MPKLIKKFLGAKVFGVYNVIIWILMLLVGVVFVYTPGDLIVSELIGQQAVAANPTTWIVYAGIFLYYVIATIFPIDAIIGRIYPIFGAFLIISAVGIFFGILFGGGQYLNNLSFTGMFSQHPSGLPFIPVFFITVACGILSGFHATQNTLIARTVSNEKEGKMTFYNMMLVEGFIAMCWAGGAMVLFNKGTDIATSATLMVGLISRDFLGSVGAIFAIIGVIVLPITSGDTAFRGLRLMVAEQFNIDQTSTQKRVSLSIAFFIPAAVILYIAKTNPAGFSILWRYFAFTNQFVATFALATISIYLYITGKNYLVSLIPGTFYMFVTLSFIFNAKIGFNLPWSVAYILAAVCSLAYIWFVRNRATKGKEQILQDVIS